MKVIQLLDEDFVNYLKPSLYIGFPTCTFKCDKDCGYIVCQNRPLALADKIEISAESLVERYLSNPITKAIVCAGLEPLDSLDDLSELVTAIRARTDDDIVVYTGYYMDEVPVRKFVDFVKQQGYKNVLMKVGRYVPNQGKHYDEIIGVTLASDKQHGERII